MASLITMRGRERESTQLENTYECENVVVVQMFKAEQKGHVYLIG